MRCFVVDQQNRYKVYFKSNGLVLYQDKVDFAEESLSNYDNASCILPKPSITDRPEYKKYKCVLSYLIAFLLSTAARLLNAQAATALTLMGIRG